MQQRLQMMLSGQANFFSIAPSLEVPFSNSYLLALSEATQLA
jgi:hypothetical protein